MSRASMKIRMATNSRFRYGIRDSNLSVKKNCGNTVDYPA
ncbi:hypothetical protein S1OALGB6SA_1789 [Olavius algarvensis spirochete endosymbiont]|nr:hypothetical protein S1OALGB6SA_1789 [Olavius algarvensis spirochete endosymbiont]